MVHLNSSPRPLLKLQGGGVTVLSTDSSNSTDFTLWNVAYRAMTINIPAGYKMLDISISGRARYGDELLRLVFHSASINDDSNIVHRTYTTKVKAANDIEATTQDNSRNSHSEGYIVNTFYTDNIIDARAKVQANSINTCINYFDNYDTIQYDNVATRDGITIIDKIIFLSEHDVVDGNIIILYYK